MASISLSKLDLVIHLLYVRDLKTSENVEKENLLYVAPLERGIKRSSDPQLHLQNIDMSVVFKLRA